jgi:hypothetical protein
VNVRVDIGRQVARHTTKRLKGILSQFKKANVKDGSEELPSKRQESGYSSSTREDPSEISNDRDQQGEQTDISRKDVDSENGNGGAAQGAQLEDNQSENGEDAPEKENRSENRLDSKGDQSDDNSDQDAQSAASDVQSETGEDSYNDAPNEKIRSHEGTAEPAKERDQKTESPEVPLDPSSSDSVSFAVSQAAY